MNSTVAELFDSLTARTCLRTLAQYLIALCSQPETSGDVISSVAEEWVGMDIRVKLLSHKVLEIFEGLIACRTNKRTNMTEAYRIRQKRGNSHNNLISL